jgi:hypothetical protein
MGVIEQGETPEWLRRETDRLMREACRNMIRSQCLVTVLFVWPQRHAPLVAKPIDDLQEGRRLAIPIAASGVAAIGMVMEAWLGLGPEAEAHSDAGHSLETYAGRREVVLLHVATSRGQRVLVREVVRDAANRVTGTTPLAPDEDGFSIGYGPLDGLPWGAHTN